MLLLLLMFLCFHVYIFTVLLWRWWFKAHGRRNTSIIKMQMERQNRPSDLMKGKRIRCFHISSECISLWASELRLPNKSENGKPKNMFHMIKIKRKVLQRLRRLHRSLSFTYVVVVAGLFRRFCFVSFSSTSWFIRAFFQTTNISIRVHRIERCLI